MDNIKQCPICSYEKAVFGSHRDWRFFYIKIINCHICGIYMIVETFTLDSFKSIVKEGGNEVIGTYSNEDFLQKAALVRHHILSFAFSEKIAKEKVKVDMFFCDYPRVSDKWIREIFTKEYPSLSNQIDYLIVFLGDTIEYIGNPIKINTNNRIDLLKLISHTASRNEDNLFGILKVALSDKLITTDEIGNVLLSDIGWDKYKTIKSPIGF